MQCYMIPIHKAKSSEHATHARKELSTPEKDNNLGVYSRYSLFRNYNGYWPVGRREKANIWVDWSD